MKIAISATGPDLGSDVDPRFGRCAMFVLVDDTSAEPIITQVLDNTQAGAAGGAGIQAAQLLAGHEVEVVLTGNCGPNAFRTLEAAGIRVVTGVSGSVRDAIAQHRTGSLSPAAGANVQSHFGTASPPPSAAARTIIAVPLRDGQLCAHFGHCEVFGLVAVNEETKSVGELQLRTPRPTNPACCPAGCTRKAPR